MQCCSRRCRPQSGRLWSVPFLVFAPHHLGWSTASSLSLRRVVVSPSCTLVGVVVLGAYPDLLSSLLGVVCCVVVTAGSAGSFWPCRSGSAPRGTSAGGSSRSAGCCGECRDEFGGAASFLTRGAVLGVCPRRRAVCRRRRRRLFR